jgi:hypothetical protein
LQAVVLGLLVAGVGAWFTYGQPQVQLTEAVTSADRRSVADEDAAPGTEGTPEPAATAGENPPGEMLADSAPGQTETAGAEPESAAAATPEPGESLAEQSSVSAGAMDTNTEQVATVADEASVDTETLPAEPKSEPMLTESVVSVSERDGAARIVPRLDDTPATRLIWWTSEYTAAANEDFIPAERQRMAAEDGSVLHIPLINDSVPESRESFFVNFGIDDLREGRIERIATVRVDIVDDDS